MAALLALGRLMRQRLPGDELDYALIPVLKNLCECGPARNTVLADRLHLDASTVSRKVRQLEDRGLVRVTPDEQDARARQVEALPDGREALHRLLAQRRDLITRVLDGWPAEDRELLRDLLNRFNHDLATDTEPDTEPGAEPAQLQENHT